VQKMEADWELSQQFISDSQGIRATCTLPSKNEGDAISLVTGNQGGRLCEFGFPSGSLNPVEYQHDHAVTALLSSEDVYFTGCKDAMIRIFDHSHQLQATLKGHEKPVSSLALATTTEGQQYLVSGSWDGTAKVWDIKRRVLMATLPGHENTVSVAGLKASGNAALLKIATGSAGVAQGNSISGHTVRIWSVDVKTGQLSCSHSVANDHDGPIRDTLAVSETCLATCSNDGTVKLRSPDTGDCISTLMFMQTQQSHPPMLLAMDTIVEGNSQSLVACAEDGHVVVWGIGGSGGEPQIILHPACVWHVTGLPNGDLATSCDDGTLRIFTRNSDRMAPVEEREKFGQLVQEAHQKKGSGPTPEEVAKLPLWENNLQTRGNSEGQVHVFNKGGMAIAAQWSMASQTWIEVGQVMGSNDTGMIDGVKYDHVFPIEVDQTGGGVAKLQIGYNTGENPFFAAQRFIDAHVLPQHHLQDVADYIRQRAGNEAPTIGSEPSSSGGTSAPAATTGVPLISYQHLPVPGYKSFELSAKTSKTTLEKMQAKIKAFGKLSDAQLEQIASVASTLVATNRYHASRIQTAELDVIYEMLESLPPAEAFPALDLARLAVAHPDGASESNASYWSKVMVKALSMCERTDDLEGPAAVAVPMLTLRLFANAFRGGPGSLQAVVAHLDAILTFVNTCIPSKNKNVRLSVSTLLYNISYYIHAKEASPEIASRLVAAVDAILKCQTYEGEAITRALLAVGTTALASPVAKETAKALFLVSRVEMSASPHGDVAKAVAKEVYNALY
jgi:phospholipase A-2-activating protein